MSWVPKIIILSLFVQYVFGQCGPAACYSGCTDARPKVDFVFLIDISGSMQPKIDGVRNGFSKFVTDLQSNSIDPVFSIVTYGGSSNNYGDFARLILNSEADKNTFINKLRSFSVSGGWEAGFESFRAALQAASSGNLGINYRSGLNNKRVYILVTDEDSDPAVYSANRYQSSTSRDGWCRGNAPSSCCSISDISDSSWNSEWQPEINFVYQKLAALSPYLYMFVTGPKSLSTGGLDSYQTCNTYHQFCNPATQSQNADFSNFNPVQTLTNIRNTPDKNRAIDKSLQGLFLANKLTARCFEVVDAQNSQLINNFFAQIVADVSTCNRDCYDYPCNGQFCQAPINRCGCDNVRNSGKVLDSAGKCCLPSEKDCTGLCNGPNRNDPCGVCTNGGVRHPQCKLDCASKNWLDLPPNPKSISTYANLIYTSQLSSVAGYLLLNSDILNNVYKVEKTPASVENHYHNFGRFEGRFICTLDAAAYQTAHGPGIPNPESHWLASLLTNQPKAASCQANTRSKIPASYDSCGQCIQSPDQPPYCVKDCNNVWRKQNDPAFFIDNCGFCVAPGTDANAKKDSCGVCNGGNALQNECGVCNGPRGIDGCNQLVCKNLVCEKDCDGVLRNPLTKKIDECKNCVDKTLPRDPKCQTDCAGVWYNHITSTSSPNIVDECGNCIQRSLVRLPACVQDCNKTWNGTSYLDKCNQCVIDGKTPFVCDVDCEGKYYRVNSADPFKKIDDCGECNPLNQQNILKDRCGICSNKPEYVSSTMCTPDCKGFYRLFDSVDRAFTDLCKDCWFANETEKRNFLMDDCGVCHKSRQSPEWNRVSSYDDLGNPCRCGVTPFICPDSGLRVCVDSCPNITCTSKDACNRCPEDAGYNPKTIRDDCKKCCVPGDATNPCNADVDSCGVCFGLDKLKNNPCGKCDPNWQFGNSTLCVKDCKGLYGGNATYGCDGVCGSTANCTTTGDSGEVISPGALAGAIIGGIAAFAALALVVGFAIKYAYSAGLIGSANKQVDFGAANSNPLYKSEVAVHQNPLYGGGS